MRSPSADSQPLHVVHYIQHLCEKRGGGVVRAILDLSQALARYGCRVTVITTDAANTRLNEVGVYGPHVEETSLPLPVVGRMAPETSKRIDSILESADVAHLHTLWDPRNLTIADAARRARIPYVASIHGMLDDHALRFKRVKKQIYLRLFGRRFLRNAYRLHCSAEGEKRQVASKIASPPIEVIPLLFDVSQYAELPGPEVARSAFPCLRRAEPKILFLSRLHPIKGPDLLIEAAGRLKTSRDFQLIMAGPGDESYVNRLRELARKHNLEDRTSFVGMVSGELKTSLYQASDLFVLPTMQENFGLVFPEALACRLPVVTTNQIDTASELAQGGVKLVARNPKAFAAAIGDALSNLDELKKLGEFGRAFVLDWLETEKTARRYIELYRGAARNGQT